MSESQQDTSPISPERAQEIVEAAEQQLAADPRYQEREAALRWLDEKWTQPHNCPVCGTDSWGIQDVSVLLVRPSGWKPGEPLTDTPRSAYPLVPLVCRNCAYTLLFNEQWIRGDKP